MESLRIGFVALARPTFDVEYANTMKNTVRAGLVSAGFSLSGPEDLVMDIESIEKAASQLFIQEIDILLVLQASFADSTLITALTERSGAPLFLWALPEARTGGRLRLNSLCGINLAGHALTLRGRKYEYAYAAPDDAATIERIRILAKAGQIWRRLQKARLGVIGEHPAGLDTCHLDGGLLHQTFGLQVIPISLDKVFQRARGISPAQISSTRSALDERLDNLHTLDQAPLNGTLSVYHALKQIAVEQDLDGLAVRCWPEFFTQMGCAACGAMSLISEGFGLPAPIPCSCEADANGTVTQMILQWLSASPAFGSDLVAVDSGEDIAVLWHCGLAPLSMADPAVQPHGGIHSNRKVPLVMEFPLRPGVVTLARLSQTGNPDQPLRMVVGSGDMIALPPSFSGTSGSLRFNRPVKQILDTILKEGLEHHISLTYGEYQPVLKALAEQLDLPVLQI